MSCGRKPAAPEGRAKHFTDTGIYHSFWAEPGKGAVILGEVSMVNDDKADNRFLQTQARFSDIVEDEAPLHLLCNEYPRFLPL